MIDDVLKDSRKRMEGAVEALKVEFNKVRTGRATPAILDGVRVNYYGAMTPLRQLANITVPESRMLLIQPYDPNAIGEVEKAIQKAGLGLTPQNDGKVIRIAIPPLTEERRKELVRLVRKIAEEHKVRIRGIRRDANEELRKMEKNKEISEDDMHRAMKEVQKITDEFVEKVDDLLEKKEEEIMEI